MEKDNFVSVRDHLLSLCSQIEVVLCGCEGETTRWDDVAAAGIKRDNTWKRSLQHTSPRPKVSELKVALAAPPDENVYVGLKHLVALTELFCRSVKK